MEEEYKLLERETKKGLQTKLNQWKHNYLLDIISFKVVAGDKYTVLIKRKPKKEV